MNGNPKLVGSNIVDCIPQTGECPNHCSECFYNGGRFFRTLDKPMFPTAKECEGKIVRVNSGNDSNNRREMVIAATDCYPHRFFNTAVPRLDFPAPVVLTINPQHNDVGAFVEPPPNLWKQHITNAYFLPKTEAILRFMAQFKGTGVRMCGTPWSSLCVDCGNCENFYWRTMRRMTVEEWQHERR